LSGETFYFEPPCMYVQGGPKKTGPFLRVKNFARVSGRKACYTSKFCKFCLEESVKVAFQCIK